MEVLKEEGQIYVMKEEGDGLAGGEHRGYMQKKGATRMQDVRRLWAPVRAGPLSLLRLLPVGGFSFFACSSDYFG